MAQLPDENVIALPQPGSARLPSSIDVGGYARGAAAMGSAYETLGKGVTSAAKDMAAVARERRGADDQLELARANGYLSAALLKHNSAIQRASSPNDLVETYAAKIQDDINVAATSISNPRSRELFILNAKYGEARVVDAATRKSFQLARDIGMAADVETMNLLREGAIDGDPTAVKTFVNATHGYIDAWRRKGWVDRIQAVESKKVQAEAFARGKLATLAPAERIDALHGRTADYRVIWAILPDDVRSQMIADAEREQASQID